MEDMVPLTQSSQWIAIKNDFIKIDDVQAIVFNQVEGAVFFNFKTGMVTIFAQEFIPGKVTREHVITRDEFNTIKSYCTQNLGAERVI